MSDPVRLWLVERTYTSRDLIVLVYATPEGDRSLRKELSSSVVTGASGTTVTAAIDVDPAKLDTVDDDETRERYATEAQRMAGDHDPDDEI